MRFFWFIRSLKEGVLHKCLFTIGSAYRLALTKFLTFWNHKRPHQGINNCTIFGSSAVLTSIRDVVRIPRGGGLVNHNERVA